MPLSYLYLLNLFNHLSCQTVCASNLAWHIQYNTEDVLEEMKDEDAMLKELRLKIHPKLPADTSHRAVGMEEPEFRLCCGLNLTGGK